VETFENVPTEEDEEDEEPITLKKHESQPPQSKTYDSSPSPQHTKSDENSPDDGFDLNRMSSS
jgi:hypothetical protein